MPQQVLHNQLWNSCWKLFICLNKPYHRLLEQGQRLSPEGCHSLESLQRLSVKRRNPHNRYFSSQFGTIMHFFHPLIYTVHKPPKIFLTSMCSSFAAEDSIHGSITDVKIKVLSCILVAGERRECCLLGWDLRYMWAGKFSIQFLISCQYTAE